MKFLPPVSIETSRLMPGKWPDKWDFVAALLVLGVIVAFAGASRSLGEPLARLNAAPLSLAPSALPGYALHTALRMLIALGISLIFTFTYATWAAKSPRAGALLVPMLDILQSVPILGFISVASLFFLSLAPGKVFGAELVAVFAIFTSQAWNMAFSFYQSLRTVPGELIEAGRLFGLNGWARFWRIEAPFAMPSLVWNMMMSMSGGWFFVVAAEAISVGHTNIALPGIGSYIAEAIAQRNLTAIAWAIGAMAAVIVVYDQILFRPLVSWADRFRIDQELGEEAPEAWVLTAFRRSRLMDWLSAPFAALLRWSYRLGPPKPLRGRRARRPEAPSMMADIVWYSVIALLTALALWQTASFIAETLHWADVWRALGLGLLTALRVFVLIAVASLIWTPIGIYVGLRPKLARLVQPLAQFLAAFPANLLFPVAVSLIVMFRLNPDVWLSPLMVLGTQWYILFNVIAGASALPRELRHASDNLQIKGWLWWRKVALPCVFPYYVTGAITASGGSWNASVVAELVSWGHETLKAHGLGAYIMQATNDGDFHRIVLGIAIMSAMVVVINRVFWRRLYAYAERKYRLT
jgi:NitT/TauT family transport system permease protein